MDDSDVCERTVKEFKENKMGYNFFDLAMDHSKSVRTP
jgi:hypothetical protein